MAVADIYKTNFVWLKRWIERAEWRHYLAREIDEDMVGNSHSPNLLATSALGTFETCRWPSTKSLIEGKADFSGYPPGLLSLTQSGPTEDSPEPDQRGRASATSCSRYSSSRN
jgi:hypothetical protein